MVVVVVVAVAAVVAAAVVVVVVVAVGALLRCDEGFEIALPGPSNHRHRRHSHSHDSYYGPPEQDRTARKGKVKGGDKK